MAQGRVMCSCDMTRDISLHVRRRESRGLEIAWAKDTLPTHEQNLFHQAKLASPWDCRKIKERVGLTNEELNGK